MTDASDGKRGFFVSFNRTDRTWATWIAWVLEEAGFSVWFRKSKAREDVPLAAQSQRRPTAPHPAAAALDDSGSKGLIRKVGACSDFPQRLFGGRVLRVPLNDYALGLVDAEFSELRSRPSQLLLIALDPRLQGNPHTLEGLRVLRRPGQPPLPLLHLVASRVGAEDAVLL